MTSINEKTSIVLTESEKNYIAMRCFILGSMTVDKREAILFLHKHGYTFKKESKGISRYLVEDIIKTIDINMNNYRDYEKNTSPAFSVTKEKAAPVEEEEQVSELILTREAVLAEVLKWHMTEPGALFIYVGLLRLQRKSNEEVYRIAWKCYGEKIPKDFGRSVRHQWERFLDFAGQRGMDRAMLNNMIS